MNFTGAFENGLQSEIFERTVDGVTEYTYVFAGTNSVEDGLEDVAQLSENAPQYSVAVSNARTLSNELGKKELTFVGHSLGGGEAAASSMATGRLAITFNRASVSNATSNKLGLNKGTQRIVNFQTKNDPLTQFQNFWGFGATGRNIIIDSGNKGLEAHKMSNFLKRKLNY